MTRRLSRKRFMTVATASIGAVALGEIPSARSATDAGPFREALEDGTPIVSGIVGAVDEESLVLEGEAPSVQVRAANAEIWKDGAATLSAIRPGDYVVAKGFWLSDDTFSAAEITPTYFNLTGSVRSTDGNVLSTTGGDIRLTDATRLLTSDGHLVETRAAEFSPGAQLAAMARREASDPVYVAVRLQLI